MRNVVCSRGTLVVRLKKALSGWCDESICLYLAVTGVLHVSLRVPPGLRLEAVRGCGRVPQGEPPRCPINLIRITLPYKRHPDYAAQILIGITLPQSSSGLRCPKPHPEYADIHSWAPLTNNLAGEER